MTTSNDIIQWVEGLKGRPINHEEGVHHGSPQSAVHGVTVCWKAVPAAIDAAGARADDLIVGHESLYYPYYFDFDPDRTPGWPEWGINVRRKAQLERYGLTGVPGVADIPFIGRLFARNEEEAAQTDIVMTLTPHVVRRAEITEDDLRSFLVGGEASPLLFDTTPRPPTPVPAAETPSQEEPSGSPRIEPIRPPEPTPPPTASRDEE